MHLEVRNLKVYNALSDDSVAFSGTLYIDGNKTGTVKNGGYGGPDEVDLPTNFSIDEEQLTKAVTRAMRDAELKRLLKKCVVFQTRNGAVWHILITKPQKTKAALEKGIALYESKRDVISVLNTLPFTIAANLYSAYLDHDNSLSA